MCRQASGKWNYAQRVKKKEKQNPLRPMRSQRESSNFDVINTSKIGILQFFFFFFSEFIQSILI